ncbi:autophagy protein 16-domain-containing protein [Rhodotorula diobovata]|uniref:Autophagy protein 16-domain-containing protein n=1 Tax=Rhodotorula diobovata TaxID=5288 RepID=A0A5C5G3M8_9BASI|nr:autophagy protein 16-domain-containing protein [Rhodotorula diobovata]
MAWQETIRTSLVARDARDHQHAPMIAHCARLAHHCLDLKQRNSLLLDATRSPGAPGSSRDPKSDALRTALITSLEAQLAQARADLSEQYRLQSANAQRLLALSDSLRDAQDRARDERDELRQLRAEVDGLRERAKWHKEIVHEKEKQLVILQDEHTSLSLELSQLELQNDHLKTDNASLLARWLEAKAHEADRMNEANLFMDEAKRLRREVQEAQRAAAAAVGVGVTTGESAKGKEKALEEALAGE